VKATLKFTLPDEQMEYALATKGSEYFSSLWEIAQVCRRVLKHEEVNAQRLLLAEEIERLIPELDG
jgi:hypothetical protein